MSEDFGFSVIFKKESSLVVRVFWLVLLCFLLVCLGFYVIQNYIKFNINPEITINTEYIVSHEIPFPAVTICSPLLVKNEFVNISKYFEVKRGIKIHAKDRSFLTASLHACYDRIGLFLESEFNYDEFDGRTAHILNMTSPTLHESFFYCEIEGIDYCEQLFIRPLTDDGYCFTFNMLGYHSIFNGNITSDFDSYKRKRIPKFWNNTISYGSNKYHDDENNPEPPLWTLEKGYLTNNSLAQPMRAKKAKLSILTSIKNVDIPNTCEARNKGYKVILHLPNEIPTIFHTDTFFQLKSLSTISIKAEVTRHDKSLRRISPLQRGCYFDDERKLKFFKTYSQVNCEYECMINQTLKSCGCVKFSMPRVNGTKVCRDLDIRCYISLINNWPESTRESEKFPCNCIQSCTQINYKIVNQRSFEINEQNSPFLLFNAKVMSQNGGINETISSVDIQFKSFQVLQTTHFTAYEVESFISDIGGLLGLFLGVSLISIFELVTNSIRLLRNKYKERKDEVSMVVLNQPRENNSISLVQPSSKNSTRLDGMNLRLFQTSH